MVRMTLMTAVVLTSLFLYASSFYLKHLPSFSTSTHILWIMFSRTSSSCLLGCPPIDSYGPCTHPYNITFIALNRLLLFIEWMVTVSRATTTLVYLLLNGCSSERPVFQETPSVLGKSRWLVTLNWHLNFFLNEQMNEWQNVILYMPYSSSNWRCCGQDFLMTWLTCCSSSVLLHNPGRR